MNNLRKKYKWGLLIPVIIRTVLIMGIPVCMNGDSFDDEMVMIQYAQSLLDLKWLGEYGVHTLNKVPAFGFFLAFIKTLNLPYMFALGVGYSMASVVFFLSIRKVMNNDRISYLCYLFMLFSPIGLMQQNVYRNSIIPTLVLLVISGYLALYYERNNSLKKIIGWAMGTGIAFAVFYLTREDSIWLGCFTLGATILIIGKLILEDNVIKNSKKKLKIRLFCVCIPIIFCFFCIQGLKLVNYNQYGVYVTTDFKDTYFADMGKEMLSIKADKEIDHVWITSETLKRMYEVSPTLSSIRRELDTILASTDEYGSGVIDGETEKDYVIWAIRWAADAAGMYENAEKANEFYRQVYEEIEIAFQNGRLEKNDKIILSNLAKPIELSEIDGCLNFLMKGFMDRICYNNLKYGVGVSMGNIDNIKLMSSITNSIPLLRNVTYEVDGWGFAYSDDDEFTIEMEKPSKNGLYQSRKVVSENYTQSNDVWEYFSKLGRNYKNAKKCRFSISLEDNEEATVMFNAYLNNELVYSCSVKDLKSIETDRYAIMIDKNIVSSDNYDYEKGHAQKYAKIINMIITVYQITGLVLAALSFIIFVAEIIISLRNIFLKQPVDISSLLIKVGLLLTIFADLLIVSINYFDAYLVNDVILNYARGIYPVWQMFICLCLFSGFNFLKRRKMSLLE